MIIPPLTDFSSLLAREFFWKLLSFFTGTVFCPDFKSFSILTDLNFDRFFIDFIVLNFFNLV